MPSPTSFGILSSAVYVPRWRLPRQTIANAIGWAQGMGTAGQGERSFANWDEDSITMAVEAARLALKPALAGIENHPLDSLHLASTSLPFADRSNAGLLREALNLPDYLPPLDLGGSRRAASSGLLSILKQNRGKHLLCASDCVDTQPGSDAELTTGHGAAAVVLGEGQPLARLIASASLHQDFVDQYRMSGQRFDYRLEARWNREEGMRKPFISLLPQVLADAGITAGEVDWLLTPSDPSVSRSFAKQTGMGSVKTADELYTSIGICGTAHPLLMMSWALEQANPGEKILLLGAGQGLDILLFEVCETARPNAASWSDLTANTRTEDNYTRYLGVRQLLQIDSGIRGERDNRTAMPAFFRHHQELTGFNGGRCSACNQLQFPMTRYCVHCQAKESQQPEAMADLDGEINSFTEDWLAYSVRPPLMFGNVHFTGGANVMMEFSDFLPGELAAGQKVRMSFRIKDLDSKRHFKRYFWKPTPLPTEREHG